MTDLHIALLKAFGVGAATFVLLLTLLFAFAASQQTTVEFLPSTTTTVDKPGVACHPADAPGVTFQTGAAEAEREALECETP